jgi:flagellar hook-basal body complex protein FliE
MRVVCCRLREIYEWKNGKSNMNDVKVDDILRQIRELSKQVELDPSTEAGSESNVDFSSMLSDSINGVNKTQQEAGKLAEAFAAGDPNVNLSQVMIEMQKARVSFETLSQVRNKLITAYQEIMNMQI